MILKEQTDFSTYNKGCFTLAQKNSLKENQAQAIKRAKKLNHPKNPSTNMYLLFEEWSK